MTVELLNSKWAELSKEEIKKGFRSIIISSDCHANVFVGVNNAANRCLILALPKENSLSFNGVVKQNLRIDYFEEKRFIVLQLTDNKYYDLFDDLIISLYCRIKNISDAEEYTQEFIQTFFKWSEFFEDNEHVGLQQETIRGLFGELLVLKVLITETKRTPINDVLDSWKGPYGQSHDFVLANRNIEVKTKDIAGLDIRISSEYQLEPELDKELELWVVSIEVDGASGITLEKLVYEIKALIVSKLGDASILFKALMQKGLTSRNLQEYNIYKFRPINAVAFDCTASDFPKLVKSNIPKQVSNLKYSVRVNSLTDYAVWEIKL